MSQFAILTHDHPTLHWDFLLEDGDTLRAWRLAEPPTLGRSIVATPLSAHRRVYLDYEGPISGDRGTVNRWDQGSYQREVWTESEVQLQLFGSHFSAYVLLISQGENWLATFQPLS